MTVNISRPTTLANRCIGILLVAMAVNVSVGTAPASAQLFWTYAWANGKCWMTMTPPSSPTWIPAPDARIWRSATNDRCSHIPVTVSKEPAKKR
jgi:hypothetical protein